MLFLVILGVSLLSGAGIFNYFTSYPHGIAAENDYGEKHRLS